MKIHYFWFTGFFFRNCIFIFSFFIIVLKKNIKYTLTTLLLYSFSKSKKPKQKPLKKNKSLTKGSLTTSQPILKNIDNFPLNPLTQVFPERIRNQIPPEWLEKPSEEELEDSLNESVNVSSNRNFNDLFAEYCDDDFEAAIEEGLQNLLKKSTNSTTQKVVNNLSENSSETLNKISNISATETSTGTSSKDSTETVDNCKVKNTIKIVSRSTLKKPNNANSSTSLKSKSQIAKKFIKINSKIIFKFTTESNFFNFNRPHQNKLVSLFCNSFPDSGLVASTDKVTAESAPSLINDQIPIKDDLQNQVCLQKTNNKSLENLNENCQTVVSESSIEKSTLNVAIPNEQNTTDNSTALVTPVKLKKTKKHIKARFHFRAKYKSKLFLKSPYNDFNFYLWLRQQNSVLNFFLSYCKTQQISFQYKQQLVLNETWQLTYVLFLQKYLALFYQTSVILKSVNLLLFTDKFWILKIFLLLKKAKLTKHNILYFGVIAELFYLSFVLREMRSLVLWVKQQLEKRHFKKHKALMLLFGKLILSVFNLLRISLNLKGIFFFFKGKLGLGGSVRKRKLQFKQGLTSLTKKNLKFHSQYFTVRTASGVVGGGLWLFY